MRSGVKSREESREDRGEGSIGGLWGIDVGGAIVDGVLVSEPSGSWLEEAPDELSGRIEDCRDSAPPRGRGLAMGRKTVFPFSANGHQPLGSETRRNTYGRAETS